MFGNEFFNVFRVEPEWSPFAEAYAGQFPRAHLAANGDFRNAQNLSYFRNANEGRHFLVLSLRRLCLDIENRLCGL
jgi:hypothetical protein